MATYPPIFVAISGVLLNATDVQRARADTAVPAGTSTPVSGVMVHFINSSGTQFIPGITVEELEAVLTSAAKDAAPF